MASPVPTPDAAGSWTKPRRMIARLDGILESLSPRRVHRDEHESPGRARLLQQARHLRVMDQEGKGAIKWTRLSCRTFLANAMRLRLHALAKSRQFPAHVADAGADQGLVTDEPERKADQDWREGSEPWPLCCFPDGRGRLPRQLFQEILRLIAELRPQPLPARDSLIVMHSRATDARTAPKCQEKRSDQPFEQRFGGLECRLPAVLRSGLPATSE